MTRARWPFLLLALAACGPLSAAAQSRVVLEGVDRYRVYEPLFEGIRVILAYRGDTYSTAYVQGISGAAFRIGGPCPCAPTCEAAMWPAQVVELLGYDPEPVGFSGTDNKAQLPKVIDRIRAELRAGRPVLAWNAFTVAEFDVVCGLDDAKGELIGRGSYKGLEGYAHAPQGRIAESDVAPAMGPILIGKKVREFNARAAEVGALKEASAHAHGMSHALQCLPTGLASYDYWVSAYQNRGKLTRAKSRDEKQDLGFVSAQGPDDLYPLIVYHDTHRAAGEFLREIAPKYPEARAHLEVAAEHFARESEALEATEKALGDRSLPATDGQCVRAAGYLQQARALYALGIGEIEQAVPLMEKAKQ